MANILNLVGDRYLSDTTWLAEYYGAQTTTNFEVIDAIGILRYSAIGSNFTYGYSGFFRGGTVNTEYNFASDGSLTSITTGLTMDVAIRNSKLSVGTSGYNFMQWKLAGNDTYIGSSEADRVYGSKGNDTLDGGFGIDVLSFNGFDSGVTVNLLTGAARTNYGISTVKNIEDVYGSKYSDTLTGNDVNNVFQGFGGNDIINGGKGFDTASYMDATFAVNVNLATGSVSGGSGSDTLTSIEHIIGSRYNDTLTGSGVNEIFQGGFGNDIINGASGTDTVEYSNVGSGVVVNLSTGTTSGGAGVDTLTLIENISGTIFADTLIGNSGINTINGATGNDVLNGGSGADTMLGGAGNDTYYVDSTLDIVTESASQGTDTVISTALNYTLSINVENLTLTGTVAINGTGNALNNVITGNSAANTLNGGIGKDIFVFNTKFGSTNIDKVTDFSVSDDTINLENSIFTKLTTLGTLNTANFKANTTGLAADANDYLVYETDTGKLFYDADGSGTTISAMQIALIENKAALTYADFTVI